MAIMSVEIGRANTNGERVKGKSNDIPYSIDDCMNTQSKILNDLIKNGKVRIEK